MRRFFAPAKVNLWLHVLGRRADGYHELDSLVAFARIGDRVGFAPGGPLSLTIDGPFGAGLAGDADNLILRAARELASRVPGLILGAFALEKNLPLASGLGGGSSDAAAALRALCAANRLPLDEPRVIAAAEATGSDVPVCLVPRARMMRGRGEIVGPPVGLPEMAVVLVNSGLAVSTPAVFAALALKPGQSERSEPPRAQSDWPARIAAARNDLQNPAVALAPAVADTLERLAAAPGARRARMSGSGATCFALFDDTAAAARAARVLRRALPDAWVRATRLG